MKHNLALWKQKIIIKVQTQKYNKYKLDIVQLNNIIYNPVMHVSYNTSHTNRKSTHCIPQAAGFESQEMEANSVILLCQEGEIFVICFDSKTISLLFNKRILVCQMWLLY